MEESHNIIRVPVDRWKQRRGVQKLSTSALEIASLENHKWEIRREEALDFLNTVQLNLDTANVDYSHLSVVEEARIELLKLARGEPIEFIIVGTCEYLMRNGFEHFIPRQAINVRPLES